MAHQTPLGRYLQAQLHARGETAEQFATRAGLSAAHAYQIVNGERQNPRRDTLEKIASGLGLTLSELERAISPSLPPGTDEIQAEIDRRLPEMRTALAGIPREFWSTVLKATMRRAVDDVREQSERLRDYATLLPHLADAAPQPPIYAPQEPRVTASDVPKTGDSDGANGSFSALSRELVGAPR